MDMGFLTEALQQHCREMAAAEEFWGAHLATELDRPANARNPALLERLHRASLQARAEASLAARNPKAFLPIEMIMLPAAMVEAAGGDAQAGTVVPIVAMVVGVSGKVGSL